MPLETYNHLRPVVHSTLVTMQVIGCNKIHPGRDIEEGECILYSAPSSLPHTCSGVKPSRCVWSDGIESNSICRRDGGEGQNHQPTF